VDRLREHIAELLLEAARFVPLARVEATARGWLARAERKRCAWRADLNRCICRSRRRVGWCDTSARGGKQPSEAQAPPVADALVADHSPANSEYRLDVTQAEAEAVVKPGRMLDHLGRKAETTVGIGRRCHAGQAAMA